MSFDPTEKLLPITQMLNAISENQKLVSANIANAHTPGYTAKKTSFAELLSDLNNPFQTELSQKMGSSLASTGATDSGQPVSLQKEMIQMQKNMLFYSMAARRASSIFSTLRTASQIGR